MMDRRKLERFYLNLPVTIKTVTEVTQNEKAVLHLHTRNICAGGAYFLTERPLAKGKEVSLELLLPPHKHPKLGAERALVNARGKVLRIDQNGMAIIFYEDHEVLPLRET